MPTIARRAIIRPLLLAALASGLLAASLAVSFNNSGAEACTPAPGGAHATCK